MAKIRVHRYNKPWPVLPRRMVLLLVTVPFYGTWFSISRRNRLSFALFTAIESLLKHCRNLTVLDVSGCSGITNCSLELFTLYYGRGDRPFLTCTLGGTLRVSNIVVRAVIVMQSFSIATEDGKVSASWDIAFWKAVVFRGLAFFCYSCEVHLLWRRVKSSMWRSIRVWVVSRGASKLIRRFFGSSLKPGFH